MLGHLLYSQKISHRGGLCLTKENKKTFLQLFMFVFSVSIETGFLFGQSADPINLFFSFIFATISSEVTWGCNTQQPQQLKIDCNSVIHTTVFNHHIPLYLSSLKSLYLGRFMYLEACKPAVVVSYHVQSNMGKETRWKQDVREASWAAEETHGWTLPCPIGMGGEVFSLGKARISAFSVLHGIDFNCKQLLKLTASKIKTENNEKDVNGIRMMPFWSIFFLWSCKPRNKSYKAK